MQGELRNCPECGRLFTFQGRNVCPRCREKDEQEYTIVRRYVRDHSGANVFEVAEETGVDEEKILRYLRDGLLESKGFAAVLECERCGKKISSGRLCDNCKGRLESEIRQSVSSKRNVEPAQPIKSGDRMYIKKEGKTKNQ